MRYYVFSVQHNWQADAENRVAPKAYDSKNDAMAEFHRQLAQDINNTTVDWSLAMIINSDGGIEDSEKYFGPEKLPVPEPEPEPEPEPTPEPEPEPADEVVDDSTEEPEGE